MASIPQWAWSAGIAAIVHDYLYWTDYCHRANLEPGVLIGFTATEEAELERAAATLAQLIVQQQQAAKGRLRGCKERIEKGLAQGDAFAEFPSARRSKTKP